MSKIKKRNYDRAVATFNVAQTLATRHGMDLIQHGSLWHFSLIRYKKKKRWLINIYPSSQTIYFADVLNDYFQKQSKIPILELPKPWTFLDVVRAAIKIKKKVVYDYVSER